MDPEQPSKLESLRTSSSSGTNLSLVRIKFLKLAPFAMNIFFRAPVLVNNSSESTKNVVLVPASGILKGRGKGAEEGQGQRRMDEQADGPELKSEFHQ